MFISFSQTSLSIFMALAYAESGFSYKLSIKCLHLMSDIFAIIILLRYIQFYADDSITPDHLFSGPSI